MIIRKEARAAARSVLAAIPMGAGAGVLLGIALGGAFLAGGMARDAVLHARASKVAALMNDDLSDQSLASLIEGEPGMSSLAARYDPTQMLTDAGASHQEAALADQLAVLAAKRDKQALKSVAMVRPNPARPWNASPLDQTRQAQCLAEAVYYEARGETPAGQAAVAQVVLNRVRHPAFPKSICAVVYQGAQTGRCQFSFACDGAMRRNKEPRAWTRAQRVAEKALGGYVMADVGNSTHFHVTSLRPGWRNMVQVAQIDSHVFYRFGGRNGAPGAFTDEPTDDMPYTLVADVQAQTQPDLTLVSSTSAPEVAPGAPAPALKPGAAPAAGPAKPAAAPAAKPAAKPAQAPTLSGGGGGGMPAVITPPVIPLITSQPQTAPSA